MRLLPILLLMATGTAAAQQAAPPHAPDGGTRVRIQSIDILPTPNAPFSATVTTEWIRTLPDGTTSTLKNHRTVARDSAGRVFEERRSFAPNGDTQETRLASLQFADPAQHKLYDCDPVRKVCGVHPYLRPATVPTASNGPVPASMGTTTTEDLGRRTMDTLDLLGSRQITTLRVESFGNTTPQPIVKEFWYSPHLQINVEVKRFDPRFGQQNFTVSKVNLSEPDPAMLTPPAEYRILPEQPDYRVFQAMPGSAPDPRGNIGSSTIGHP